MNLRTDSLLDELRRLVPEVSVSGGSFAHWLPHPSAVPPGEHSAVFGRTRRDATQECLIELLRNAGLPAIQPGHIPSGARDWPVGYTGSVSHKGTKVVAALTRIGRVTSVGIDIETLDGGRGLAEGLIAPDELPEDSAVADPVILLSAKEAVFKALNPVVGIGFGFEEVQIVWKEVTSKKLLGIAHFRRNRVNVRCSTAVPSWVASVALLPQQQMYPQTNV